MKAKGKVSVLTLFFSTLFLRTTLILDGLTTIFCSHVSRSMLRARTPDSLCVLSGPVKAQAVCLHRHCCCCLLLFIQLLYNFSAMSLFARVHTCHVLNHLWGKTSLSSGKSLIFFFPAFAYFAPSILPASALRSFHAQHKNAGLPRTSFFYQFPHPLWNAVLLIRAPIWKDRSQISCSSHRLHPSVQVATLSIKSSWLLFPGLLLSSCLRETCKSRHWKENLGGLVSVGTSGPGNSQVRSRRACIHLLDISKCWRGAAREMGPFVRPITVPCPIPQVLTTWVDSGLWNLGVFTI